MPRKNTTQTAEERLAAIRAKNAEYARRWRAKNPEKAAQITRRYWEKRVAMLHQTSVQESADE